MKIRGLDLEYLRFSNFRVHQNYLESLLKLRFLDPTARVSDSVGLGWGSGRICISNKFTHNPDAAGPHTLMPAAQSVIDTPIAPVSLGSLLEM